jgi:hypothetical protein
MVSTSLWAVLQHERPDALFACSEVRLGCAEQTPNAADAELEGQRLEAKPSRAASVAAVE